MSIKSKQILLHFFCNFLFAPGEYLIVIRGKSP